MLISNLWQFEINLLKCTKNVIQIKSLQTKNIHSNYIQIRSQGRTVLKGMNLLTESFPR